MLVSGSDAGAAGGAECLKLRYCGPVNHAKWPEEGPKDILE